MQRNKKYIYQTVSSIKVVLILSALRCSVKLISLKKEGEFISEIICWPRFIPCMGFRMYGIVNKRRF